MHFLVTKDYVTAYFVLSQTKNVCCKQILDNQILPSLVIKFLLLSIKGNPKF